MFVIVIVRWRIYFGKKRRQYHTILNSLTTYVPTNSCETEGILYGVEHEEKT